LGTKQEQSCLEKQDISAALTYF